MPIIVETEKVVDGNGKKMRKILAVAALERRKLPGVYYLGFPRCYMHFGTFYVYASSVGKWVWYKGGLVSEEEFQNVMAVVAEAGARLREVNKEHEMKIRKNDFEAIRRILRAWLAGRTPANFV